MGKLQHATQQHEKEAATGVQPGKQQQGGSKKRSNKEEAADAGDVSRHNTTVQHEQDQPDMHVKKKARPSTNANNDSGKQAGNSSRPSGQAADEALNQVSTQSTQLNTKHTEGQGKKKTQAEAAAGKVPATSDARPLKEGKGAASKKPINTAGTQNQVQMQAHPPSTDPGTSKVGQPSEAAMEKPQQATAGKTGKKQQGTAEQRTGNQTEQAGTSQAPSEQVNGSEAAKAQPSKAPVTSAAIDTKAKPADAKQRKQAGTGTAANKPSGTASIPAASPATQPAGSQGAQTPKKSTQPRTASKTAATSSPRNLKTGGKGYSNRADDLSWREDKERSNVKHGPFSDAEVAAIKAAIKTYAETKRLDPEDLSWLFDNKREGSKGAMTHIAITACPNRKRAAVADWCRRHLRHEPEKKGKGKWTEDEVTALCELVDRLGTKWAAIAPELGRTPEQCRDKWRDMGAQFHDQKQKGAWSSDEVVKLEQLIKEHKYNREGVQAAWDDAQLEAEREQLFDMKLRQAGGMWVLDRIDWDWVACHMKTRSATQCRQAWYRSRAPSMVARGIWAAGEDNMLLKNMMKGNYAYEWQVPWTDLVPGREVEHVRRRWALMKKSVKGWSSMELPAIIQCLVDKYLTGKKQKRDETAGQDNNTGGEGEAPPSKKRKKAAKTANDQATEGADGTAPASALPAAKPSRKSKVDPKNKEAAKADTEALPVAQPAAAQQDRQAIATHTAQAAGAAKPSGVQPAVNTSVNTSQQVAMNPPGASKAAVGQDNKATGRKAMDEVNGGKVSSKGAQTTEAPGKAANGLQQGAQDRNDDQKAAAVQENKNQQARDNGKLEVGKTSKVTARRKATESSSDESSEDSSDESDDHDTALVQARNTLQNGKLSQLKGDNKSSSSSSSGSEDSSSDESSDSSSDDSSDYSSDDSSSDDDSSDEENDKWQHNGKQGQLLSQGDLLASQPVIKMTQAVANILDTETSEDDEDDEDDDDDDDDDDSSDESESLADKKAKMTPNSQAKKAVGSSSGSSSSDDSSSDESSSDESSSEDSSSDEPSSSSNST